MEDYKNHKSNSLDERQLDYDLTRSNDWRKEGDSDLLKIYVTLQEIVSNNIDYRDNSSIGLVFEKNINRNTDRAFILLGQIGDEIKKRKLEVPPTMSERGI